MNNPLDFALREFGTQEILGPKSNPEVEKYFNATSLKGSKDAVAWCSAFVNWCFMQASQTGTGKANARSWLDWGNSVITPELGDIVVLWRNSKIGAKGHVGFFIRATANHAYILGGNQNNKVCIERYPLSRVLGYRRAR